MVDALGSRNVTFGNPNSAPPTIWQKFQAHPTHQQQQMQEGKGLDGEPWLEGSNEELGDDVSQFDEVDDLQNSILRASIRRSGFFFLDALCSDDAAFRSQDPAIIAVRNQSQAAADADSGRALTLLCSIVIDQLHEQQIHAAYESVRGCHHLQQNPHASAYFQGELALARWQLTVALDNFQTAIAGPLPELLYVSCHIGLAATLRGLQKEAEGTKQLRSALKIFPHNCDLLLACAQHVLILGRSKDEAEALLQYAISVHPRSIKALLAMARFQLAYRHSPFTSSSFVNSALQIDPEHCDSLVQRAIVHAATPHSSADQTRALYRKAAASQVCRSSSILFCFCTSFVICCRCCDFLFLL
jgi:tetratricopeptide (TPR) repeat protein